MTAAHTPMQQEQPEAGDNGEGVLVSAGRAGAVTTLSPAADAGPGGERTCGGMFGSGVSALEVPLPPCQKRSRHRIFPQFFLGRAP